MISCADSAGLEGCAALTNTVAVSLEAYLPASHALICRPCFLQVSLMWSHALPPLSPCSGKRLRQYCLTPAPEAYQHLSHISPPARLWLALLSCTRQKKSVHGQR